MASRLTGPPAYARRPALTPNRDRMKFTSITPAKAMVAITTTLVNFGVTLMLKNLYAASVTPAATKVPSTAWATMPLYICSKILLIMPMKTPSMTAYTKTSGGDTRRRNETSKTTPKPTSADRISAGMYRVAGTIIQDSAAVITSRPITTAVLVMTSSRVIRPSTGWTPWGAWP